jgi:hypothetical protein
LEGNAVCRVRGKIKIETRIKTRSKQDQNKNPCHTPTPSRHPFLKTAHTDTRFKFTSPEHPDRNPGQDLQKDESSQPQTRSRYDGQELASFMPDRP